MPFAANVFRVLLALSGLVLSNSAQAVLVVRGLRPIGTMKFVWTDPTRTDPESTEPGKARQLIVQMWYPTTTGIRGPKAPYW